jgi:hypothetical protein
MTIAGARLRKEADRIDSGRIERSKAEGDIGDTACQQSRRVQRGPSRPSSSALFSDGKLMSGSPHSGNELNAIAE